jgi:hypothetical protein
MGFIKDVTNEAQRRVSELEEIYKLKESDPFSTENVRKRFEEMQGLANPFIQDIETDAMRGAGMDRSRAAARGYASGIDVMRLVNPGGIDAGRRNASNTLAARIRMGLLDDAQRMQGQAANWALRMQGLETAAHNRHEQRMGDLSGPGMAETVLGYGGKALSLYAQSQGVPMPSPKQSPYTTRPGDAGYFPQNESYYQMPGPVPYPY